MISADKLDVKVNEGCGACAAGDRRTTGAWTEVGTGRESDVHVGESSRTSVPCHR